MPIGLRPLGSRAIGSGPVSMVTAPAGDSLLYFACYPAAQSTPTWTPAGGWVPTPVSAVSVPVRASTGTQYSTEDFTGLTAETSYRTAAVVSDGVTTGDVVYGDAWETAPLDIFGSIAAQESGADAATIVGAVIVAGALSAAESGADAAVVSGAVTIAGTMGAAEQGADTASIVGGNILAGYMAAQESGSDTAAASGAVVVSGAMAASEAGADGFAASGSIGAADVIGNFAALESGDDTISVSGVVIVSGALAAAETGSDTMQTTTGEGYPSSVTITVPSGRTITLRPR